MPFYEYQCNQCNAEFQHFARTMKAEKPTCPKCSSRDVTKKLSVFGVGAGQPAPAPSGCSTCPGSGGCPMAR